MQHDVVGVLHYESKLRAKVLSVGVPVIDLVLEADGQPQSELGRVHPT